MKLPRALILGVFLILISNITLAKGGLMYEASIGGQKFNFKPLGD